MLSPRSGRNNVATGEARGKWQGQFYSCPLDPPHLWEALRYAELNPVRAGMVEEATLWPWSSAAVHCGIAEPQLALDMDLWRQHWQPAEWREYLAAGITDSELAAIRTCTHTGRPLGTPEFITDLERTTRRHLAAQKGGRPAKPAPDARQDELGFEQ